jgi:hypothetical protein
MGNPAPMIRHPNLIRWVSQQDRVKGFLTMQEYTSAYAYKLNLNELKVKLLIV